VAFGDLSARDRRHDPGGQTARLRWRTPSIEHSFRSIHLYLPTSLLSALADEYRAIGQSVSEGEFAALAFRDETVANQVGALLAACRDGAPDLYAAGAARWLLTHLLSSQAKWRHLADDTRMAASITDRRLARVIEYMTAHLCDALTLDQMASEAGISVHHFGRRFRESTGMGPAAYLTLLRMAQAKLLLRTTDLAIAEVGVQCGYPKASAFATAFLRHAGTTPSRYRAA
jgi:AraC family transcriptional regulator